MTSLIRSIARTLKLGRARYLVGSDLDQNTYYEYPSLDGDPDPRRTRRLIRYKVHKEMGEYDGSTLPVQWSMWLRHTRRSAPTLDELREDRARIAMVQANAARLALEDTRQREAAAQRRLLEHEAATSSAELRASTSAPEASASSRGRSASSVPTSEVRDDTSTRGGADDAVWAASRARVNAADGNSATAQYASTPINSPASTPTTLGSLPPPQANEESGPHASAILRRAARRRELDGASTELERARIKMRQSPLADFDIEIDQSPTLAGGAPPTQQQQPQQHAMHGEKPILPSGELKARYGRAVGPDEEYQPEGWTATPRKR